MTIFSLLLRQYGQRWSRVVTQLRLTTEALSDSTVCHFCKLAAHWPYPGLAIISSAWNTQFTTLHCRRQKTVNHIDSALSINKIWKWIAITPQCWRDRLAGNHCDYSTQEMRWNMPWLCRLRHVMVEQLQWTVARPLMHVAVSWSIPRRVPVCCQTPSPVHQVTTSTTCCAFTIRCLSWSTSIDTTTTRRLFLRFTSTAAFFLCNISLT